ncbi:free fatty acid receptor 2 [Brachyhypopomus gauderio]|uniref:free fatty acid receptor 2 n=1 Tax=Brachyhypopomus gauderio TaxID=698409 RepID=UPI00404120D0
MGTIDVSDGISLVVYSFTFLLGLPANILVFFMYVRKANKRGGTPNGVYGINLCLSNLILVAWMPLKVVEMVLQNWMLPELLCPIYNFFLFASLYGSGVLLTAVAVGRYLSIAFPITYKLYRRARASCLICTLLWTIVLLHLSFAFVTEKDGYIVSLDQRNTSRCYENFTQEQLDVLVPLRLEMALLLFTMPLLLSAACTLRCLALVRRSCLSADGKRRVLAAELLALAAFVVCYAPYNASHVSGFVQKCNVEWKRQALIPSSCNVFLEPVMTLTLSAPAPGCLPPCPCGTRAPQRSSVVSRKDPLASAQRVASLHERQMAGQPRNADKNKEASPGRNT